MDVAIDWLRGKPAGWRVADFGCGDARLARTVQQVHALCGGSNNLKRGAYIEAHGTLGVANI